ncbi:MAG: RidA family protein [Deltaproteobacteria bacterium]|nr:RidA family protein [Deltaproteobacteria bacterium]
MRMKTFDWLGREFVAVSCEGSDGVPADQGMDGILDRIEEGIGRMGLSLGDTVRTRLWARDRESRNLGSQARSRRMRDGARSSSSSYIAPGHLDSEATVALDFIAMRSGGAKRLVEYDPPIVPLRYLDLEGLVFLSGVTSTTGNLAEQVTEVCGFIGESLEHAGISWEQAVLVSFFLHEAEDPAGLKEAFERAVAPRQARTEWSFVDGYSAQGKLIEIEVTAQR